MLNERGDTTIYWSADRDAEVERIIEKKMAEGCVFFICEERGLRTKLQDPADARRHRALAIPDEDWAKFCGEEGADVVKTPEAPVKTIRKAKTAKEVASAQSVGVKRMVGG
jgi:hypothetical protein